MMKQALIVIDVQDSFKQRPYWDETEVPAFLGNVQRLISDSVAQDIPVVQIFHTSKQNDPKDAFARSSGHVATLDGLNIAPAATFYKTVHSSLFALDDNGGSLHDWLGKNGIEGIIVCGIRTEQCCETTARHASDAGFAVRFVTDATLTFPMQSPSGKTYSSADIRDRTELVLNGRFARIVNAASAFAA